jgi:hypothetical protein
MVVKRQHETFEPVTMGHIRSHGCRDLLVCCISGRCHHSTSLNSDCLRDETPVRFAAVLLMLAQGDPTQCGRHVHAGGSRGVRGRILVGPATHFNFARGCIDLAQFGQHLLRFGPRWYPGGHARPLNIGWQRPPGPRHHPGPHPSATVTTMVSVLPLSTGVTAALPAVAKLKANAAPKYVALIIMCVTPCI